MQTVAEPKPAVPSVEQELIAAGDGLAGNADVLRSVLAGCGRLHQDPRSRRPDCSS